MVNKVLIPLDGSKIAEQKIEEIIKMFKTPGKELTILLIHVIELYTLLPHDKEEEFLLQDEWTINYLNQVKSSIRDREIKADVIIKKGKPPVEICEEAIRNNVDLVALASHGHGRVAGWALGSVSDNVVRHCKKPVLVLKVA